MTTPHIKSLWWLVVAAAAVLMITMGIRMSLGLFVQPWDKDTSMSISHSTERKQHHAGRAGGR